MLRRSRAWVGTRIAACCLAAARFAAADPSPHVLAQTGAGSWLHAGSDHVAISRELPGAALESEAVRLVFVGFAAAPRVRVSTRQASGTRLDSLDSLSPFASPCPPNEPSGPCWSTQPLRLTPDALDRAYEPAHERSLEAELGGELQVESAGLVLGSWRVGAPNSPLFAGFGRLGARLRVRILRVTPGGMPTIGGDVAAAEQLARSELLASNKLWAQCGVDLQGQSGFDIQVVDPPPVQLPDREMRRGTGMFCPDRQYENPG